MSAGEEGLTELVRRSAREADPDRYLAALFAPADARPHLFALVAFNAEMARIPDAVNEPMLGQMRLAWWREAISGASQGTDAPVAAAVRRAVEARGLTRSRLGEMIDAREFDVTGAVMPDRQALDVYLGKTDGALFALSTEVLAGKDAGAEVAARLAGRAYGLARILRNVGRDAARGRVFLPEADLAQQGLTSGDILDASDRPEVGRVLSRLIGEVRSALEEARRAIAPVTRERRLAFLPLALVEPALRRIERAGPAALRAEPSLNPLTRLWSLTRAAATGRP